MKRLRRSLSTLNPYTGEADRSPLDVNTTEASSSSIPEDENCTMPCHHGGSCVMGRPVHGFSSELLEDEDKLHYASYNTAMYCMCPTGWTGMHCEVKLRECPSSSQVCANQQACLVSEDDFGMPFRHCECDPQETDFTLPYVTHFCGQAATTLCKTTGFLCKNGGTCLETTQEPGYVECDESATSTEKHVVSFLLNY